MVKNGYKEEAIRETVKKWFAFVNPSGFSGKGCYSGNCEKPFNQDGCGGMDPKSIKF
ncbi:MAG: hypothetical protein ACK4Y7_04210 [Caldimicrobium sp.]